MKKITQAQFNDMKRHVAQAQLFGEMVGGDGHEEDRDFAKRLYMGLVKAKTMLTEEQWLQVSDAMGIEAEKEKTK